MWNWIVNNKEWILSGIGIFALSSIAGLIGVFREKCFAKYRWIPLEPIRNAMPTKHISEYLQNPEFDFVKREFTGRNVTGEKSFTQSAQKFVLTERNRYQSYSDNYGTEEAVTIFLVKDKEEFARQCGNIAHLLMEWDKEWIQEIYKIYRRRHTLVIEMKVKGKPETLKCEIPNIHQKVGKHHKTEI